MSKVSYPLADYYRPEELPPRIMSLLTELEFRFDEWQYYAQFPVWRLGIVRCEGKLVRLTLFTPGINTQDWVITWDTLYEKITEYLRYYDYPVEKTLRLKRLQALISDD